MKGVRRGGSNARLAVALRPMGQAWSMPQEEDGRVTLGARLPIEGPLAHGVGRMSPRLAGANGSGWCMPGSPIALPDKHNMRHALDTPSSCSLPRGRGKLAVRF
jgi:hypothetical protein